MELAAQVVDSGDGACGVMGVGRAAAAAVQLGEAVGTFLVGVDIAALELINDIRTNNAFIDITHQKFFLTNELVTWI